MQNGHQYENRLVREKSPYLLQHAHNPVDWYPWGEEAFKKAKEHEMPIFLQYRIFKPVIGAMFDIVDKQKQSLNKIFVN
jgi:hypothetical protein